MIIDVEGLIEFVAIPIVGGALAASGLILAKKPDAKAMLDKIAPYSGSIGIGMFVDGVYNARWLPHVGDLLKASKLLGLTVLILVPSLILVGFLLGFGLASKYIFKGGGNPAAQEKAARIQSKLATYAGPLGLLSIAGAIIYFLFMLTA
jgi:hypothetical protein